MEHARNKKKYLTVVLPAYNEEKLILKNLLQVANEIEQFAQDYQMIAVNDGSTDRTKEEIEAACRKNNRIRMITYNQNRGKGYAIKKGILAADSEFVAFLDSDLELPPYLLKRYLAVIKEKHADIVIGSKMHKDSKLEYPLIRKILSYGYYILLRILFRLKLKDTQTGIKLFRTEVIQPIMQRVQASGFSFDIEMLAIASLQGCKIIEMPVEMKSVRRKQGSRSKISVKQIFNMFSETFKIKKRIVRLRKK